MSGVQAAFDVVVAIVTGAALWAFLPRGVVLTRELFVDEDRGPTVEGCWRLRNDSAIPVRVISATVESIDTFNETTGRIETVELSSHEGVTMSFDDPTAETVRQDSNASWSDQVIPPGDMLTVTILNLTTLTIRYRRAGWTGVFERRQLQIHGRC